MDSDHGDVVVQVFTFQTPDLRDLIIDLLEQKKENLHILNWAMDNNFDLEEVISFLELIDVNRCRELATTVKSSILSESPPASV